MNNATTAKIFKNTLLENDFIIIFTKIKFIVQYAFLLLMSI